MSHTYIRVSRGKDLAINWPVLVNNQPADLTGLDLSLVRYEPNGKEVSMQFTVEDGVIATVFRGRHQTQLGNYRFRLWANRKQNGETHYDFPELFTLVRWEWEENIPQGSGVNVVTLNLSTGNILIGAAGQDADIEAAERAIENANKMANKASVLADEAKTQATAAFEASEIAKGQASNANMAATRAIQAALLAENNVADVASLKGSVVAADTLNDKTLSNLLLGHVALNAQKALVFRITKGSLIGKIILVNKINSEIVYTYLPFMSKGDFAYINSEIGYQDLDVILESGMVMQDTEYEIIVSGASVDAINFLAPYLDRKVDKENGKGLSTQDFTTALKEKLESLSNYDDTEVRGLIANVQSALNTLVGSEDATQAIDTFNEVISFLDSFKGTDSLASTLSTLKTEIQTWVEQKKYLTASDIENKVDKEELSQLDSKVGELERDKQDKLTEEQMENVNADLSQFLNKTTLEQHVEDFNRLLELFKNGSLGDVRVDVVDAKYLLICGVPETLVGAGTPSASVRPSNLPDDMPWGGEPFFVGQKYINTSAASSGLYYAVGTSAVGDWKQA